MNKKIIGILVMTLLITTAVPVVTCMNNINSYTTISSTTKVGSQAICNESQKADIISSTNSINILKKKTIYVDDDKPYSWYDATHVNTIQNGTKIASAGDTIFVYNGVYYVEEGHNIMIPLNLIGEDKNYTVIKGNQRADVIRIKTSNVNISNFTIKWSYRKDASKTFAGIRIDGIFTNINISNNILTENSQGIVLYRTSYVNIYNNKIYNNDYDGIVLQSCNYCFVNNNTIYENGFNYTNNKSDGDGFDMRSSNYNKIVNNNISNNKVDGIWLDGGECLSNNLFLNNQILGNEHYGIHFGNSDQSDCSIKNNNFSHNLIKNNYKGGISIRYAKENYIFENNIEGNGDFGIKILYNEKDLICKNNKIYHNNLIKNGEYELFYNRDYKKFYNAVDSNNQISLSASSYNQWDNGTIDDKIGANLSSEKGGNYWNDYGERYNKVCADDKWGYHGIWKREYNMKIQLHLFFFKGKIDEIINFDFYESKASDRYPWCRMNGWNPSRPDKPLLNFSKDNVNPLKYSFTCSSSDLNDDKIIYEVNITKSETNETITTGWQIIRADPINASDNLLFIWKFEDYDTYNIQVRSYDVREGIDNSGKGFDGLSEISQITIRVE